MNKNMAGILGAAAVLTMLAGCTAYEVALGVTYENIDDYLEGKSVPEQVARTIENWYLKTEHKRRPPITVFDNFWKK